MKKEYVVYEVAADQHTVIAVWNSITKAAQERGVTKQAIHQALVEGTSSAGSYWFTKEIYETREAVYRENRTNLQSVREVPASG